MDEIIIEPGRGLKHYWRDLWAYRELFYFLAWRDITVRYKQTVIGVAWSLVRPFLTMGVGLWFASLNVKYRDFRFIVPFVVQFGIYASPVGFSSNIVPAKWRLLYSLNPMVGVIDGFRWAIIGGEAELYVPGFLMSIGLVALLLASGIWYFRRTERTFAD